VRRRRHTERGRELRREILRSQSDPPSFHLAELDELRHYGTGHVARNREPDPYAGAARPDDRRVDADQLAAQIDQRTAGVAGIDRGIGLNEIFIAFDVETRAAERADDPRSHRLTEPEWIADRHHVVAHPQCIRIAQCQGLQVLALDFQQSDVGGRIASYQLALQPAPVLERDRDLLRVLDHVMIGEHVAAACVDDDTRARRDLRPGLLRQPEEAAEKRIPQHRIVLLGRARQHSDVHHSGRHLLEQRCERGHLAIDGDRRYPGIGAQWAQTAHQQQ